LKKALEYFPREWPGGNEQAFPGIILDPADATRISSLLYEECDRGLVNVRIDVTSAPRCIMMGILLSVVASFGAEYAKRGLDRLIKKIRERLNKRLQQEMIGLGSFNRYTI
jgi:hypothetical protein